MLNLVRILLRVVILPLFLLAATTTAAPLPGQTQQQRDEDLPAEDIIAILQHNPDVLADAKAEIAAELRDRGYPVTDRTITDDRLFSEIRSDDRARHAMSEELKRRGFGQENDQENAPAAGQPPAPASPKSTSGQSPSRGQHDLGMGGRGAGQHESLDQENDQPNTSMRGPTQDRYALRDLPALRDLYMQATILEATPARFGASLFRNSAAATDKAPIDIPVGPDYVIGPGDELVVEYWGSSSQRLQLNVDRQGMVVLPEVGALVVSGRSLEEARQSISRLLMRQFRDVNVDVTLGKLRDVRIYVVGDVKNPGAYDISALSTCLSALIAAGGPTETGSYRLLKHYRGQKLMEEVDLYDLMLKGVSSAQVHLASGDSILVPPAGPQVTLTGAVRRPAIYELRKEQTLDQALELAGGVPVSGQLNNLKLERIEAHQRKEMLSVALPDGKASDEAFQRVQIRDGDVVTVAPILPFSASTVYLQGHVFRPGKYPYSEGTKVTDLIHSFDDLLPEAADRAEIVRLHAPDYSPAVIGFSLREVLEKRTPAPELQPFDTIRVFGRYETDAPKASIYGSVLRPGEYPLSDRMSAADLLRLAGGFRRDAYQETADLTSYSVVHGDRVELEHRAIPIGRALAGEADTDVILKPGDVLTIGQIGGWNDIGGAITVNGEVLHPGRYGIQRGERLSSILRRAGGLSGESYPYGAVLERAQVREFSAKNRDNMVANLQEQTAGVTRLESSATLRQQQQLINQVKQIQPSGRLLIHIGSPIEKWENTAADVEVRPGDSLFIPKRPNFVMVAGQVYNPAAITYIRGRSAAWYLKQAGGPTSTANQKDIFVIRANGVVVGRGSNQWWLDSVSHTLLQPGDTVYVPDKVSGTGRFKNVAQSVQILTGIAVAANIIRTF